MWRFRCVNDLSLRIALKFSNVPFTAPVFKLVYLCVAGAIGQSIYFGYHVESVHRLFLKNKKSSYQIMKTC